MDDRANGNSLGHECFDFFLGLCVLIAVGSVPVICILLIIKLILSIH